MFNLPVSSVRFLVYVPDEHPLSARLNRFRKKYGWPIQIRNPRFWNGEIERCSVVVVEDRQSDVAKGYEEAGIKVRVLKPRRVAMKPVIIDLDRQEARENETKLNISLSKTALAAKRKVREKKATNRKAK